MSLSAKYHIAAGLRALASDLGFDPVPLIVQAGLPRDFLEGPERPVTGPQYFALWNQLAAALPGADLPKTLSDLVLNGAQDPSGYAFYSSPTLRVGMQRKVLFKPLIMPIRFDICETGGTVTLVAASAIPGHKLPEIIGWFYMVFLLSIARRGTAVQIVPRRVEVAAPWPGWRDAEAVFGGHPEVTGRFALSLRASDMDRPLITRDPSGWEDVARDFEKSFAGQMVPGSTAERVRHALLEGLPGGQAGADQIALRMGLSKRSLQRRLGAEGLPFKEILEDTRRALALSYLQRPDLSVQEIALLLGFQDPSSFFRAFKSWTGQTPAALRGLR